jgi:hypothetical protein
VNNSDILNIKDFYLQFLCLAPPANEFVGLKRVLSATYTFVCCDGKLMPENFPARQFSGKANKCFGVCIVD